MENKLKKPKLQSPYKELPTSSTFREKKESRKKPRNYLTRPKVIKKRGRRVIIRKDGYIMNNGKGGFR